MKDDYMLHLETKDVSVIADSTATKPGTKARLSGASNELSIESTGAVQDDKKLKVNDVEVVTGATLRQYVSGIINGGKIGLNTQDSGSLRWSGGGDISSPLEALAALPIATEGSHGIVKVVNEGSHGYPAAGYSCGTTALIHDTAAPYGTRFMMLRNGADDLEKDVFISWIVKAPSDATFKYTPTADRFRPAGLPATAKPVYVEHSCNEAVLLMTTDGPYVLVTGGSIDTRTWICRKIPNPELQALEWNHFAYVRNGTLFIISPTKDNVVSTLEVWSCPLAGTGALPLVKRQITGVNGSRRQVTAETFPVFDKVIGLPGEQAFCVNADPTIVALDTVRIIHAPWRLRGNCYSYIADGNMLRITHRCYFYLASAGDAKSYRSGMSYTLNLDTLAFNLDLPEKYPITVKMGGVSFIVDNFFRSKDYDYSNCILFNAGRTFVYDTYGPNTPMLSEVVNTSGLSDYANTKVDVQHWDIKYIGAPVGLYGTVLKMGFRGIANIGRNTLTGASGVGDNWTARYDPYGSYSPTIRGYGPVNDRKLIESTTYFNLNDMVYEYDGDECRPNGYNFTDRSLDGPSTYVDGKLNDRMYMAKATFDRLKNEILAKIGHGIPPGDIYETNMQLGVWRNARLPCTGTLAIIHTHPTVPSAKRATIFYFQHEPSARYGEVKSTSMLKVISNYMWSDAAITFDSGVENWVRASPSVAYRLTDGNYVITGINCYLSVIGDGQFACPAAIYSPSTMKWIANKFSITSGATMEGWLGTRELGIGWVVRLVSAEGVYLDSYGTTTTQVMQSWATDNKTRYCLMMTRTDAGDNVTMSQLGATKVRDKIQSLIPPARRVQGMDLSQDRTITKAMLANSDKIPNQRDSTYPVQQKHTDSANTLARTVHTHVPGDFMMATATLNSYGTAVLSKSTGPVESAVSVAVLGELAAQSNALWLRPHTVENKDATIPVDVEL